MIPRIPSDMIEFTRNTGTGVLYTLLALALLGAIPQLSQTQPLYQSGEIEIEPTGVLWLEGSASIVDYRCYAEQLDGAGVIANSTRPERNVQGEGDVYLRVTLPVKTLDCGKEKMNRDMYEALKADRYPDITYRLLGARLTGENSAPDSVNWMHIQTRGLLSIAGVTDTTVWTVQGHPIGENRFRVKGSLPLNMKDHDVTPPTAVLGLIRASEELTVHFDVTVYLKE